MGPLKQAIKKISRTLGYEIISSKGAEILQSTKREIGALRDDVGTLMHDLHYQNGGHHEKKSQLSQDLFVLLETGFKRDGFFVEFGATNGVDRSNTWLLEKDYGWTGILAEPATVWHENLHKNRTAKIETDCVWSATGEKLQFNMAPIGEYSTIEQFSFSDHHAAKRMDGNCYEVTTISLLDLLRKHKAPKQIDYLSIDTEGSEFDIIEAFDFAEFQVDIISVEHNYSSSRQKIYDLLVSNGYRRKLEALSQWDDWYVRNP